MKYSIETVHFGTVQFLYSKEVAEGPKHWAMEEKFRAKLEKLTEKMGVTETQSFCCQGEGYQVQGEDREQVEATIKALASYISRFKGVEIIT